MGHSAVTSQALAAPPYLLAFAVVLVTAFYSDRLQCRGVLIGMHALLASLGYMMIAVAGALKMKSGWRYAGVYPATCGFFSAVTLIITWTINNQRSESGQGTGLAMLNIIGQLGPFVGTRLYPESDGPYYVKGMATCAGFMVLVCVFALILRQHLISRNVSLAIKDQVYAEEQEGLVGEFQKQSSGTFRYLL